MNAGTETWAFREGYERVVRLLGQSSHQGVQGDVRSCCGLLLQVLRIPWTAIRNRSNGPARSQSCSKIYASMLFSTTPPASSGTQKYYSIPCSMSLHTDPDALGRRRILFRLVQYTITNSKLRIHHEIVHASAHVTAGTGSVRSYSHFARTKHGLNLCIPQQR